MDNSNTPPGLTVQTDDSFPLISKALDAAYDCGLIPTGAKRAAANAAEQALRAAVSALQAENDKLLADAERCAFLRDRMFGADFDWNGEGVTVLLFKWPHSPIGADFNATVDAARAITGDING